MMDIQNIDTCMHSAALYCCSHHGCVKGFFPTRAEVVMFFFGLSLGCAPPVMFVGGLSLTGIIYTYNIYIITIYIYVQ
jgi:hypothetical protein